MYTEKVIFISSDSLVIKGQGVSLSKIRQMKVCEKSSKEVVLNFVAFSLFMSSTVWLLPIFGADPKLSLYLSPVFFILGFLLGFFVIKKYQLKIEVSHSDETGIQWVSVAKSNSVKDCEIFSKIVSKYNAYIN
ncbi:hypothetical protein [Photobacterium sp. 1_MG-2023]|uniref:hypothetical protein n=1 Tax=Photobacterium sp. 1_MG-2023 TaxID=3062646 RepID=UPI0026E3A3B8|nr:hypothetical protein [Photobacterium sp. 1_MG-2023]MDO6706357.1 hypothetical protein [Photobacterium sp. 1_MG-2023]